MHIENNDKGTAGNRLEDEVAEHMLTCSQCFLNMQMSHYLIKYELICGDVQIWTFLAHTITDNSLYFKIDNRYIGR